MEKKIFVGVLLILVFISIISKDKTRLKAFQLLENFKNFIFGGGESQGDDEDITALYFQWTGNQNEFETYLEKTISLDISDVLVMKELLEQYQLPSTLEIQEDFDKINEVLTQIYQLSKNNKSLEGLSTKILEDYESFNSCLDITKSVTIEKSKALLNDEDKVTVQELEEKMKQLEKLKTLRDQMTTKISDSKSFLNILQNEIKLLSDKQSKQNIIEILKNEVEECLKQETSQTDEIAQKTQKIDKIEININQVVYYSDRLKDLGDEDQQYGEYDKPQAMIQHYEEQIAQLREEIKSLQEQIYGCKNKEAEYKIVLDTDYQSQIDSKKQQIEAQEKEIAEFQEELAVLKKQIIQTEREYILLKEKAKTNQTNTRQEQNKIKFELNTKLTECYATRQQSEQNYYKYQNLIKTQQELLKNVTSKKEEILSILERIREGLPNIYKQSENDNEKQVEVEVEVQQQQQDQNQQQEEQVVVDQEQQQQKVEEL